jgi:adenosylcobinamide-phosphate synthase
MGRDARAHASPNAGWPEAAIAGALGFRLGGPRSYGGGEVTGAWLGDGKAELGSGDILRALELYRRLLDFLAGLVALAGLGTLAFLFF